MTDKTTKILLAIIAAGLWLNAATVLIRPALAQDPSITNLARDFHTVVQGQCPNQKLC